MPVFFQEWLDFMHAAPLEIQVNGKHDDDRSIGNFNIQFVPCHEILKKHVARNQQQQQKQHRWHELVNKSFNAVMTLLIPLFHMMFAGGAVFKFLFFEA